MHGADSYGQSTIGGNSGTNNNNQFSSKSQDENLSDAGKSRKRVEEYLVKLEGLLLRLVVAYLKRMNNLKMLPK